MEPADAAGMNESVSSGSREGLKVGNVSGQSDAAAEFRIVEGRFCPCQIVRGDCTEIADCRRRMVYRRKRGARYMTDRGGCS
jgi:hypothetical protein